MSLLRYFEKTKKEPSQSNLTITLPFTVKSLSKKELEQVNKTVVNFILLINTALAIRHNKIRQMLLSGQITKYFSHQ